MKTILVTGGAGFIGSHLCKTLLHKNQKVIIIDNFNDFYDPKIKKNNIEEIKNMISSNGLDSKNIQIVEGDIRDIDNLDKLLKDHKIELIVHLAAMAGVRPSINNPLVYNDVNIKGTVNSNIKPHAMRGRIETGEPCSMLLMYHFL